jgi:hypothetical protein
MQKIETPQAIFEYDGNGLLIVTLTDDIELDLEDIKKQREIAYTFHKGKPNVVLAIAGQRTTATEDARKYASSNVPEGRVAEAIIIKSLSVRLMGNFYLNFHKPNFPTKIFSNKEEALVWLKEKLDAKN